MLEVDVDVQVVAALGKIAEVPSDRRLSELVAFILERERADGVWSVTVRLTDDEEIRVLHRDFMGVDTATDIMTFPHADVETPFAEHGGARTGGDLVISIDHVRANAVEAGWSAGEELLFVIAHGVLHLLGWDDEAPADRDAMLRRQEELLRAWSLTRPLASRRSRDDTPNP